MMERESSSCLGLDEPRLVRVRQGVRIARDCDGRTRTIGCFRPVRAANDPPLGIYLETVQCELEGLIGVTVASRHAEGDGFTLPLEEARTPRQSRQQGVTRVAT